MDKPIIYQLLPRLWGNDCGHPLCGGSLEDNGTGKLSDERITEIVRENFDFRPAGIIKELTLRRPIYRQTAAYGHFGREDVDLPWERLDKANELKKYL